MKGGGQEPRRTAAVFGRYGESPGSSRHWKMALLTASVVYLALGVVVIGTAPTHLVGDAPAPVPVTFVEKVARPEPLPVVVEAPKPPPKLREVKPQARPAAAAAAPVPKNMKVRKLAKPAPPKEVVAPQEMPKEAPKEADPSLDKGVAVYGDPADADPGGLEGSGGAAASNRVGALELPDGAVPPKPYKTNRYPRYPRSALASRRIGVVRIRCVVKVDGHLDDVEIISGDEPFISEARKALRRWRYRPATHQGKPIAVLHEILLRFELDS